MIQLAEKKDCCGCSACRQVCPEACIRMEEDAEGFLYPVVDAEACIDCGLCEETCPFIAFGEPRRPQQVYAVKSLEEPVRASSSSGGVFPLFVRQTLAEGGVVFGARFNSDWEVETGWTDRDDDARKFYGSKYVQSAPGDAYRQAEAFLKAGRPVLFSGTPCQVAGLKGYLAKDYENLFTVDFICHGVPSPGVWRSYLKELCGRHLACTQASVGEIAFRDKFYGWKKFGLKVSCVRGGKNYPFRMPLHLNAYLRGFLNDLYLRPSCHACAVRGLKSGSDVTLGDYWGCSDRFPGFDDDRGVSAVLLHTKQGVKRFEALPCEKRISSYEDLLKNNGAVEKSAPVPAGRAAFFISFPRAGVIGSVRALTGMSWKERLKARLLVGIYRIDRLLKRNG